MTNIEKRGLRSLQLREIRSKFKAGNIEGIAVNAEVIAITALLLLHAPQTLPV